MTAPITVDFPSARPCSKDREERLTVDGDDRERRVYRLRLIDLVELLQVGQVGVLLEVPKNAPTILELRN